MLNNLLDSVFVGKHERALDAKHRIAVPAEWRGMIEDGRLFILPGINKKCLEVLTSAELNDRIQNLKSSKERSAQKKLLMRWVAENATMVTCDAQGRIRLSDTQMVHAGISKDVVMSGAFSFFEIRSAEEHAAQSDLDQADLAAIAEEFDF
jgi:MraZ protein